MADAFDPYHVWLGIPPEEQPPNRYRLLSIKLFESNPDVIDGAADRQAAHLRTFQSGQNAKLSQRLLNEVAAARVCLLKPESKAAYDQKLRASLGMAPPVSPGSEIGRAAPPPTGGSQIGRSAPAGVPAAQPLPSAMPLPQAGPIPQAAAENNWDALMGSPASKTLPSAKSKKTNPVRRSPSNAPKFIGAGVALVACIAAGVVFMAMRGPGEATLTFDWPAAERAGASLTVDGQPVTISADSPWELHYPPGNHQLVAERGPFKFETTLALAAGDQQTVAPAWKPKAKLAFAWPLLERTGATLLIDGRAQSVSQAVPLELPMEPGRHVVRITRPNSEPFEQTVVVAPDEVQIVTVVLPVPTVLVLDWPIADRHDAQLWIDNEPQQVDLNAEKLEFHVKPGQHTLRLARPGFATFEQAITIEAGSPASIIPQWKPLVAKTDPMPSKPVEFNPIVDNSHGSSGDTAPVAPEKPAPKTAPPSPAALAAAIKTIRETFSADYAKRPPEDQAQLAKKLFDAALETKDDPSDRFALLAESRDLAAHANNTAMAIGAIDQLAAEFDVDAFEMKLAALVQCAKESATPGANAALAETIKQIADDAVAAEEFATAQKLLTLFKSTALKSKDMQLIARATHADKEFADLRKQTELAKAAADVLKQKPDDAEANLTVGKFECFWQNDWAAGLPKLANGSDADLKKIAARDLSKPQEAADQASLGDAWWLLAGPQSEPAKGQITLRALHWYSQAVPGLSGFAKAKTERRIEDAEKERPTAVTHHARTIDLLKLVDVRRDTVQGKWELQNGILVSRTSSGSARIEFPYQPPDEYDYQIVFARVSGVCTVQTCSAAGHQFEWVMDAYGHLMGFDLINGQHVQGNPSAKPCKLLNGQRYVSVVKVRKSGVQAYIDSKFATEWKTDFNDMSLSDTNKLHNQNTLGFAFYESPTIVYSAKVIEITGVGKRLTP